MQNILKSLFVGWLILASNAFAETQVMNGVDDGTVHIQLGHAFPYYGGVFTDAWMSSNGFILLYDPVNNYGNSQTWVHGCCNGFNPSAQTSFKYMIAPLWTDVRHDTSVPNSGYFYETGEGGTWFEWRNVVEYGTNNISTFGLQLWPEGSFDFHYADINIQYHNTWIGFTGDTHSTNSAGIYDEVNELFYKTGQEGGMTTSDVTSFTDAETNFGYAWWGQDGGYSSGPDCSNPLNDPSCEGYEQAYFEQQCNANPLYDQQCPGYEQAYYDQQCSANPLYDSGCPGYEQAYYDQQCSISPLYDSGCPGYAEAYYDQQCGIDPLYDSGCDGYEEAYYNQQCSLDALYDSGCDGYGEAFLKKECDIDPLYSTMCSGYAAAKAEQDAKLAAEKQAEEAMFQNQSTGTEDVFKPEETYKEEETIFEDPVTTFDDTLDVSNDTLDVLEVAVVDEEKFVEKIVEEAIEQNIAEDPIKEEAKIAEEIFVEEVVEEEIAPEPEIIEEIEEIVEEEAGEVREVVDISTILEIVGEQQEKDKQNSANSAEMSVSSQNNPIFENSNRSELHQAMNLALETENFGGDEENMLSETEFTAVETTTEQKEATTEEIIQNEDSFSSMDAGFESQMTESFAMGGNIGTFLSGEAPNFQKFDIKPPTVSEQRQTKKVESLADKMSNEAIAENTEKMAEKMQESGGFDGDQAVTVTLMGFVPDFNQYRSADLQDQQQWYDGDTVYNNQRNVDNTYNLYKMVGSGDERHKEMVLQQYGR